jgi:cytoskeletal protein RodZ
MSSLSEAEHPPILHYLLIALAVVVVLGLIAGGVWFFAIRRPAQQVMETLPTVPALTSSTDDLSNPVAATAPAPSDEPISSGNSFTEPEVIPSKPVVTPPVGTNVPPPTSIDPNTAPPMIAATNTAQAMIDPGAVVAPITPPTDDQDKDGLSDAREVELGTDAMKADTDGDGLSDGDEVLKYRTNPLVPDTDGDTFPDGVEVQKGYNPLGAGKCANPACTL